MNHAIQGLKPAHLWNYFAQLAAIPHRSKEEQKLAAWIIQTAREKGFVARTDSVSNIVVEIPATPGYEKAPTVILQGHIDMVCEKNEDTVHDFATDPIELVREDDWITANGTTLGADNGIGVAAALAFMDEKNVVHGPLELLCTIDEETGMTGAFNLQPDFLKGRYMLNLDSEEDGALYVGCAGGADIKCFFDVSLADAPAGATSVAMSVKGLRGGHSGLNIIENRANALRIMARILKTFITEGVSFGIIDIEGGSARNAIPREINARLAVLPAHLDKARALAEQSFAAARTEYGKRDTDMHMLFDPKGPATDKVWSVQTITNVVDAMLTLPTGVLTMSQDLPNLVESSCNLATINVRDGKVFLWLSARSSVQPVIAEIQETAQIIGKRCGATVELGDGYPAWQPDMDSPLLQNAVEVFERLYGAEPQIKAIHAGLECGIIGEKFEGIKMISMGPEIHGAHSPDERVLIPTVEKFWALLSGLLTDIAEKGK
ncbi:aminoacyl-histidine dipeptidase [Myxococcota bacterium]|nr:aminoacyl-histidine dipeptidase [Myxococcota bacterium]